MDAMTKHEASALTIANIRKAEELEFSGHITADERDNMIAAAKAEFAAYAASF